MIYCIIPAFNEEKSIKKVVYDVKQYVDKVIVVDDGSDDKTYDLANSAGAIVLRHIINRGQGAALKTGTEYALNNGARIIVHFDADGQFLAADLEAVVHPIKSGQAEVVFGSRFLIKRNFLSIPLFKYYIILPLARLVNRLFFKVNFTDPQSGFRAMTSSAFTQIDWSQDRMAHCSEILAEVKRYNFKIVEVPIKVVYHNFGQRFSDGIKILKDLFLGSLIN